MSTSEITRERQNEEKESGWSRGSRYFKYLLAVMKNVVGIWLIYLEFGKVNSTFEMLVLAGLVLILQSVSSSFTLLFRTNFEENFAHRALFVGIYKKLNGPDIEDAEENLRKMNEEYHKTDAYFYINSVGSFAIYLFVLWKLVNVLVLS